MDLPVWMFHLDGIIRHVAFLSDSFQVTFWGFIHTELCISTSPLFMAE